MECQPRCVRFRSFLVRCESQSTCSDGCTLHGAADLCVDVKIRNFAKRRWKTLVRVLEALDVCVPACRMNSADTKWVAVVCHGSVDSEKNYTRGRWDDLASRMTDIFAQSEHHVAGEHSKTGTLKMQHSPTSIHFTADDCNVIMLILFSHYFAISCSSSWH